MKKYIKISKSLFFFVLLTGNLQAWGPIAHYSIGRDLGYGAKSGNMNLPDAWENRTWNQKIHDWFTWTHAVQRTGRNWYGAPNVPRYVDDGREPGRIMHILAENKIKWENDIEKQKALDTALGFVGHNAMDRLVHWDYFLGGSFDNWTTHHRDKEEWADYVIAIWKGDLTFDEKGKIKTLFGVSVQQNLPFPLITASGSPKVIQLAQKVARKNRRYMDFEDGKEQNSWTRINSIKEIETLIANMNKNIEKEIKKMTLKRYEYLLISATTNNWVEILDEEIRYDEIMNFYEQSKITAQRWINELP